MTAPQLDEEAIFNVARQIGDAGARSEYLREACGGDEALIRRVEALLAVDDGPDSLLDRPALRAPSGDGTRTESPAESDGSLDFLTPSDKPGSLGRLGHYEVQEVVGRGGMGVVLRAFDETLHRVVAVKVMAPQLATAATARRRFAREARAAAAVRDEHVVNIYAVEEAGPQPYLVMEYVAGASLQERLDRAGPLPVLDILRIGVQAAAGLAAAHAQGLIHRDVKPSNILLENGVERVKLTDFGLARAADDASLTQSGTIAGTPQYMAPEQARGEALDHRADLFSLGSVLYALCTGRAPFRASGTMAVLKRVCETEPRPIAEVSPETPAWLIAIVARLQAKAPEDRFQSAAEVADVLGQCLAHVQQPALVSLPPVAGPHPAPRDAVPGRGAGRRRWPAVAAVLVVLACGLVATEATGLTGLMATVLRTATPAGTPVAEPEPSGQAPRGRAADEAGNLVVNGSFEEPALAGEGLMYSSDPTFRLPGWTFPVGDNRLFLERDQPCGIRRFSDGRQAVCLNGDGAPAYLSQTLDTVPGRKYMLTFTLAEEQTARPSPASVVVTFGALSQTFGLGSAPGHAVFSLSYRATSSRTALEFRDNTPGPDYLHSPFIDAISVTASMAEVSEAGAFVILGRKGLVDRTYDALADAVRAAADGDTIEVRGNGPFDSPPIDLGRLALAIRAGDGFRPVVRLDSVDTRAEVPLLRTDGPLVLEGIEWQRVGLQPPPPSLVSVVSSGGPALYAAHCRFLMGPGTGQVCIYAGSARCVLRYCELLSPLGRGVWGFHPHNRERVLDNCLHIGAVSVHSIYQGSHPADASIRLTRNTFVVNQVAVGWEVHALPDPAGVGRPAPPVEMDVSATIFDGPSALCVGAPRGAVPIDVVLQPGKVEGYVRRMLTWRDRDNVYAGDGPILSWVFDEGATPPGTPNSPADWRRFWGAPDAACASGPVRYRGGNLFAKLATTPAQLRPEDFRLRPDSAGYRAGKDGKDLGADVDLVGPGPAYERWQKTPEYQHWLKDTGQVK